MNSGNQDAVDDLSADDSEFVRSLLDRVPVSKTPPGNLSTWVTRVRRDFDMTDQYGDP